MLHKLALSAIAFAKRLPVGVWAVLGALLAIGALVLWYRAAINDAASHGRTQGAQIQRDADLRETIKRVEQSNDTRQTIESEVRTGAGGAAYRECLRTARTPANCERFMPSE